MTAWSAKVSKERDLLVGEGPGYLRRLTMIAPIGLTLAEQRHGERGPRPSASPIPAAAEVGSRRRDVRDVDRLRVETARPATQPRCIDATDPRAPRSG